MVYSMTGFANKTILIPVAGTQINMVISLKSLNSRFFEATCKLPFALTHLETDLIKLFKTKLARGHIYFTIQMSNPGTLANSIKPSLPIIKGYLYSIELIKKEFNISGDVSITDLIALPNIFDVQETGIDANTQQQIINQTDTLISQVIKERLTEGMVLQKDLQQRIKIMSQTIENIEEIAQLFLARRKQEVQTKLQAINQTMNTESDDTSSRRNALYMELDKIDIHEEIVRFKSHLQNSITTLASDTPEKGKRLDFTLQELVREINTITAKCSDVSISSLAINIKVEVEKAREQVQNIV